jgi:hypothetical protein
MKNFENFPDEKENAIAELKLAFDRELSISSSSSISILNSNQVSSLSSSSESTNSTTSTNKSLLTQCFDSIVNTTVKSPNQYQEIDDYFNVTDSYYENYYEDDDIDVLSYWREKQNQFPVLAVLAKQIYAIPASNTVVERLFSASKNLISEKRTNLASEKINQLLFLQKNYKLLKQLLLESRRKRTISMSSTTTISSEDSTCTVPKQPKIDAYQLTRNFLFRVRLIKNTPFERARKTEPNDVVLIKRYFQVPSKNF